MKRFCKLCFYESSCPDSGKKENVYYCFSSRRAHEQLGKATTVEKIRKNWFLMQLPLYVSYQQVRRKGLPPTLVGEEPKGFYPVFGAALTAINSPMLFM